MYINGNYTDLPVVIGSGAHKGTAIIITISPGELLMDQTGLVLTFTRRFEDGAVGHFVLLPDDEDMDTLFLITEHILIPLGIELLRGRLLQEQTRIISSLADAGADYLLTPYIQRMCREFRGRQYSYYATDNGECVFKYRSR